MFGKALKPVYERKMNHWRCNTAILWENDVKCHDKAMGVWGKLKEDHVKVIKDLDNKRMKRKEDPIQNRISKCHIATRRKVRSLIPSSPVSQMPQPILTRDETQLLVGKTRSLVLIVISKSKSTCGASLVEVPAPPDKLTPSDHRTFGTSTYRGDHQPETGAPFRPPLRGPRSL